MPIMWYAWIDIVDPSDPNAIPHHIEQDNFPTALEARMWITEQVQATKYVVVDYGWQQIQ